MESTTPFVTIVNNGSVFALIRQSFESWRSEIVLSNSQFSGLMHMLISIEKQFLADEMQKRVNEMMQVPLDVELSIDEKTTANEIVGNVQPPPPSKKMKKSNELESLIIVYAMLFWEKYKQTLSEQCNGCLYGKLTPEEHDVCMMMKKRDRINLVFDSIMAQLTDEVILQKLHEMKDDENVERYTNKNTLLSDMIFVKRLKSRLDKYIWEKFVLLRLLFMFFFLITQRTTENLISSSNMRMSNLKVKEN